MGPQDSESNGLVNFAESRRVAESPQARAQRLSEELGFAEPKDVKPPFIPGETPVPQPPAAPPTQAPVPTAAPAPASTETPIAAPTTSTDPNAQVPQNPSMLDKIATPILNAEQKVVNHLQQFEAGSWDVIKNIGQTAIDVADGVDNWMQKRGFTETDFINNDYQFDPLSGAVPPPTTSGERASRFAGKFAVQAAAFVAGGSLVQGGKMAMFAGGMATGAAVNFAAFDPHEERLGNMLEEIPALRSPFAEYFASMARSAGSLTAAKEDDSAIEGRFKNAVEGIVLDAALAPVFLGIARMYKGARAFKNGVVSGYTSEAITAGKEIAQGVDNAVASSVTHATEQDAKSAAPTAAEATNQTSPLGGEFSGAPPKDVPNGDLAPGTTVAPEVPSRAQVAAETIKPQTLDQAAAATPAEFMNKAGNINLNNVDTTLDVKSAMANVIAANPDELAAVTRGIVSDAAVKDAATAITFSESERLLGFKVGQAFNAEELAAVKMLTTNAAEDYAAKVLRAVETSSSDDLAAMLRAQGIYNQWLGQLSGGTAEAGRALRATGQKLGSTGALEKLRAAEDLINLSGGKEEALTQAARIAQVLKQPDIDKVKYLNSLATKNTFKKIGDAVFETWINSMLTAAFTKNLVQNTIATGVAMADTFAGSLVSKLPIIGSGEMHLGEAGQSFIGAVQGLKDSLRLAVKADTAGVALHSGGKLEFARKAISSEVFQTGTVFDQAIDVLGNVIRLPGTSLQVTDDFFKATNYRMTVQTLAWREAEKQGLQGAEKQAFITSMITNPPDNIQLYGQEAARRNTFTSPLTGSMKDITEGVKKVPYIGKVVAPFTRISVNLTDYALQRNPFLSTLSKAFREDMAAGGWKRDVAIGKLATGSAVLSWLTYESLTGKLTGPAPSDSKAKANWEASGKREYSVLIGDTYHSISAFEGAAPLMKMGADLAQILPHLDDQGKAELVSQAAFIAINGATPDFIIQSIKPYLEAQSDPQGAGQRYVAKLAGTVVPTGVAALNRRFVDTEKRYTQVGPDEGLWEKIKNEVVARTPTIPALGIAGSKSLPPVRNPITGAPVEYPHGLGPENASELLDTNMFAQGLYTLGDLAKSTVTSPLKSSKVNSDPVQQEIVRLQMSSAVFKEDPPEGEEFLQVGMPRREIGLGGLTLKLDPQQYDKLQLLSVGEGMSGPSLHDELAQRLKGFEEQKTPDYNRKVVIRSVIQAFRKRAQAQLIADDPSLRQKMIEQNQARVNAAGRAGPGNSGQNEQGAIQ